MSLQSLRVGIVGAGANTRLRHIPGLRSQAGVEIVGVVNRSPQSTERVALEFAIPQTFSSWQDLVAAPDIDAVVIGTWPNLHCEVTLAALAAGKHVLCEARMARNLAEAQQMAEAARANPHLVAQLVPSPLGLECGETVSHLIKSHYLGDLREVIVLGANDQFWDYSKPLHWRQDAEISGNNILTLGILHETLLRWVPGPVRVMAQAELFEPNRPVPSESRYAEVTIPDSLQVLTELQGGARAIYHLSGAILFGPGMQIHLYGSRGTIKIDFNQSPERVWCGRAGDSSLEELEIPAEDRGSWQVEAEFIQAIRGERKVKLNDFATGLRYMEFTEAVALSLEQEQPVELPLADH